jgi:hypothetical protein
MFFIASFAFAQRTTTLFQKTYKISSLDTTSILSLTKVVAATDGGYAFLGNYESRTNKGDMCVIRTDSLGSILWTTNLTSDTTEAATGINQTPDGGFVVSGFNILPNGGGQMILAKIDANGVIKWINEFGGSAYDEARDAAVLSSGDIFVVGTSSDGSIIEPGYAILAKKDGNPENGKLVRFSGVSASFYSVDKTTDGGAIAAARAGIIINFDAALVKFNSLGNVVWGKRYATPGSQLTPIVRQTRDGGYILAGQQGVTQPNGQVVISSYAIKTNALGDTLWCKAFRHETDKWHRAYTISEATDGYIISGNIKLGYSDTVRYRSSQGIDTFYLQDHEDPYALKIDQTGAFKWAKAYGDSTRVSRCLSGTLAADGGFTLSGETYGFGSANKYGAGYVIHADKDGSLGTGSTCRVKNLIFNVSTFRVIDSSLVSSVDYGEQKVSTIRKEAITVVRTNICTGTGLNTDVADYHLPDNAVKIYPNPVNTQLSVEIDEEVIARNEATSGSSSTANVTIFDATGRLIEAQKNVNDALKIDVSAYAHGIYILKVERGGKYLVKKFIVE